MAVKIRLSGGASNAVVDASLGGAKSSVEVGTGLLDVVSGAEAAAYANDTFSLTIKWDTAA